MKKPILFLLALSLISCHQQQAVVVPPVVASMLDRGALLSQQNVDATIYQNSSAEGVRLFEQCYELAKLRLDQNLARPHDLPPAVIVDIDETVLDNSAYQVTNAAKGRTYTKENWNEWALMGAAKALPGAVEFLKYAVSRECAVYYITNRAASEKIATIKNLFELGFPMADEAHVMTMDGDVSDKTDRRALVSKGHYVALLCGDQLTDFDQRRVDQLQHDTFDWHGRVRLRQNSVGSQGIAVGGAVDELRDHCAQRLRFRVN